jgi:hypothetical protein
MPLLLLESERVCENAPWCRNTGSNGPLCEQCVELGWTVIDGKVYGPKPQPGHTYYTGYPHYRCGSCGRLGGH